MTGTAGPYGPESGAAAPPWVPGNPGNGEQAPAPAGQYGQYGQYGQQYDQYGQYGQYGQQYGQASQPPVAAPPGQYGQYGQYGQAARPDLVAPQAPADGYGQYGPVQDLGRHVMAPGRSSGGIIPLRPLTVGEIYDGAFRAIRANPGVLLGLSAIVFGGLTIVQATLGNLFVEELESAMWSIPGGGRFIGVTLGFASTYLLAAVASVLLTGPIIVAVSEAVMGRRTSLGQVWQRSRRLLPRLFGASVLVSLLTFVMSAIAIALSGLVLMWIGSALMENVVGSLLMLAMPLLWLAIYAASIWVAVRFILAPPVIMLEHAQTLASLRRSWHLTRGQFWRTFGIILLTGVIVSAIVGILGVPFGWLITLLSMDAPRAGATVALVGAGLATTVVLPFVSAVVSLIYIDIRMRTEGLDVILAQQAAEA